MPGPSFEAATGSAVVVEQNKLQEDVDEQKVRMRGFDCVRAFFNGPGTDTPFVPFTNPAASA